MPIKEKPQLLEFNCTLDEMEGVEWNVKYDPNDKIAPLHISGNGQSFHCPVELFGDVTAFLQSKNIIKPQVLTRSRTAPGMPESGTFAHSLLPPSITGKNDAPVVNNVVHSGPPMDALASFDITNPEAGLEAPQIVLTGGDEDGPYPGSFTDGESTIIPAPTKAAGTVVTPNTKSEVISRPVIRTRVNKDDPQSAEKEAALIRGVGAAGAKKTIKKKHQVVE
jgi:hypothetical protein